MKIPDELVHGIEGYEFNIMYRYTNPEHIERLGGEWKYHFTNRFSSQAWYPSESSVKRAMSQLTATRYGHQRSSDYAYKIVRRPYGVAEDV